MQAPFSSAWLLLGPAGCCSRSWLDSQLHLRPSLLAGRLGSGTSHVSRRCVGYRHFCQLPLHTGTQRAREHGVARGDHCVDRITGLLAAVVLLFAHRIRGLGASILTTLCIAALVGGTLSHAPPLRAFGLFSPNEGRWLVITVMGVTIVSLAVANFVDRRATSHPAAGARPNRTLKGAGAGVAAAVLFGVFLMPLPGGGDPITSAVISYTLGVAVQLGDLFHRRLSGRLEQSGQPGHFRIGRCWA